MMNDSSTPQEATDHYSVLLINYAISSADELIEDQKIDEALTAAGLNDLLELEGSGVGFGKRDLEFHFTRPPTEAEELELTLALKALGYQDEEDSTYEFPKRYTIQEWDSEIDGEDDEDDEDDEDESDETEGN